MTMLHHPDWICEAMTVCALRFDGYRYEQQSPLCQGCFPLEGLSKLFQPVVKTLTLYADENLNWAAFFGLQRFLGKSGGEYLTAYSAEHIAFDFLFLHLYHLDVPDGFRDAEYCATWQGVSDEQREEVARFVRNSLRRKGRGPKAYVYGDTPDPTAQYREDMLTRYWDYRHRHFAPWASYFERPRASDGRPPVFLAGEDWRNVLVSPTASPEEREALLALVPAAHRHKWFRSMSSSQSLAQSVLGNLAVHGHLSCLSELRSDDGEDLMDAAKVSAANFTMEYKVHTLRERRPTSLDAFFGGAYRVAIECKLSEGDVGACSHPGLSQKDLADGVERCDGNYSAKALGHGRCPLSERGVLYWRYIPLLFRWRSDSDMCPCPLDKLYQLVRNILAVGVQPAGTVSAHDGHVILIYDGRNPAFQPGGKGLAAYLETREALREPAMLRRISWQRIVDHVRYRQLLPWLTDHLELKYGL